MKSELFKSIPLTTLVFSIITLTVVPTFASAPPPTPTCHIEGTIKSIEFKGDYSAPCLIVPRTCPTDRELTHPARYYLDVEISSVSYLGGPITYYTCEKMYPVGGVATVFIDKDKIKPNDKLEIGKKVEGSAEHFGVSSLESYSLTGGSGAKEPGLKKSFPSSSLITALAGGLVIFVMVRIIRKIISLVKKIL